jgi:GTP-binding protein Era
LRRSAPKTRCGRVALVGRPNVGKSTLLNALLGEPIAIVSPLRQTTRTPVSGVLTTPEVQYILVDTPGFHPPRNRLGERMNVSAQRAIHDADAIVLLAEVPREGGEPRPHEADLALAKSLPRSPALLAVTKVDRLRKKELILPFVASFSEARRFAACVPVSARRSQGLRELLAELRELLPEGPFLFDQDTLSDQPMRFFVAEFVREQVLRHVSQEVPHGIAVVVERFDEARDVTTIEAAVHVARDTHKKILVGAGGRMLKSIGIAARARIERMLERHVHLRLWVRSTPGWMNDESRLDELGFVRPEDGP